MQGILRDASLLTFTSSAGSNTQISQDDGCRAPRLDINSPKTILDCIEKESVDCLKLPQNFMVHAFSLPLQLSQEEVVKIRDSLQEWARWDVFKSLANYRVVVETLFDLLKNNLMQDLSENDHAEKLAQSLSQDVHALHDQLFSIFGDPDKYKIFLSSRGDLAQKLIDLLQDVLDSLPETTARTRLFKALLRLSRVSGLHPTCFALTGLYVTGRQVAAGGFSDIWKGQVRGKSVSVKIMRLIEASEARTALQEFGREALIWRQLSHPNLLPFLGLHYLDNKLCLVSPWMSNGHILQFLKTAPPDVDRVSLMLDVAMGLEYLHGRDVVHGDLKGTNILVTPSHRACVADFGLSTIVDAMTLRFSHSTASVNRGGTARYQSPELLSTPTPNHFGSDVYAYACVCYEIWTGKAPFFELPRDGTVIMKVVEGLRPSRPTTIPFNDSLWLLLQDCWKTEPRDRPSASQIVRRLLGPAIRAKARDSAKDWDETISSKCRRSLQDWPLLPSVASIERRVFGDVMHLARRYISTAVGDAPPRSRRRLRCCGLLSLGLAPTLALLS